MYWSAKIGIGKNTYEIMCDRGHIDVYANVDGKNARVPIQGGRADGNLEAVCDFITDVTRRMPFEPPNETSPR
jgi:hypothetical protein